MTPNVPEARALTGLSATPTAMPSSSRGPCCALGPRAVVVTGGHREQATDVFFDGEALVEIPGERYPDGAAHGSGCTHSSVLAARLAWGDAARGGPAGEGDGRGRVRDGLVEIGAGAGPVSPSSAPGRAGRDSSGAGRGRRLVAGAGGPLFARAAALAGTPFAHSPADEAARWGRTAF